MILTAGPLKQVFVLGKNLRTGDSQEPCCVVICNEETYRGRLITIHGPSVLEQEYDMPSKQMKAWLTTHAEVHVL